MLLGLGVEKEAWTPFPLNSLERKYGPAENFNITVALVLENCLQNQEPQIFASYKENEV